MLRFVSLSLCLMFLLAAATPAMAQRQMTKAEKKRLEKEWKNKAKQFSKNPMALRDNQEGFKRKVDELTKENETLEETIRELQADLSRAQAQLSQTQGENQELRNAYEAQKNVVEKDVRPGLVFKVQIGAFRYFDMAKYLKETTNFEGESADNLNRYTLGNFRDLEMAEGFQKDMQKMGIRDAWIVPFRDGVRIEMRQAKQMLQTRSTGSSRRPAGRSDN